MSTAQAAAGFFSETTVRSRNIYPFPMTVHAAFFFHFPYWLASLLPTSNTQKIVSQLIKILRLVSLYVPAGFIFFCKP